MPEYGPPTRALLRLTLAPGLGPVFIARLLADAGSAEAAAEYTESGLRRIKGIGADRARTIAAGLREAAPLVDRELELAQRLGVRIVAHNDPEYPALLREIPDAPPILSLRGRLEPSGADRYPLAIVGSRSCTQYGLEQAGRFAAALGQAGLTIVSGGARGIDTAAHQSALRVKARTVAVLGCGLADCYPPDNRALFDSIVAEDLGAVVSELPLNTPPNAENFPARNRIISGLSLGVLVVEAGRRSGALITARLAVEEHGREVFALPSRVDSLASQGSLDLLKSGGAALVTHADDILAALESPARHQHQGTHEARYTPMPSEPEPPSEGLPIGPAMGVRDVALSTTQQRILGCLDEPRSMDQIASSTGLDPSAVRADITVLEIRRRVRRQGPLIARST